LELIFETSPHRRIPGSGSSLSDVLDLSVWLVGVSTRNNGAELLHDLGLGHVGDTFALLPLRADLNLLGTLRAGALSTGG
jgi:hypothetical protein